MKNKRAEMTTKEVLELILSVAVIIVLVILFFTILSPFFDRGDKTSEAYLDSLVSEIKDAKSGEIGEFFIWNIDSNEGISYHLVYFGNRLVVSNSGVDFTSKGDENNICICSSSLDKGICNHCSSLDNPSSLVGNSGEGFVVSKGEKVSIEFKEDKYEFRNVQKESAVN